MKSENRIRKKTESKIETKAIERAINSSRFGNKRIRQIAVADLPFFNVQARIIEWIQFEMDAEDNKTIEFSVFCLKRDIKRMGREMPKPGVIVDKIPKKFPKIQRRGFIFISPSGSCFGITRLFFIERKTVLSPNKPESKGNIGSVSGRQCKTRIPKAPTKTQTNALFRIWIGFFAETINKIEKKEINANAPSFKNLKSWGETKRNEIEISVENRKEEEISRINFFALPFKTIF